MRKKRPPKGTRRMTPVKRTVKKKRANRKRRTERKYRGNTIRNISRKRIHRKRNSRASKKGGMQPDPAVINPRIENGYLIIISGTQWIPDDKVNQCMKCEKTFGMLRRRHHCRTCGGIYCYSCISYQIAAVTKREKRKVLACNNCIQSLERYKLEKLKPKSV